MQVRYSLHFQTLAVAAVIFWFSKDLQLPYWISNFDFLHYALMGAYHSASFAISVRTQRDTLHAIGFIALAAILSGFIPLLALLGAVVWLPFADILRDNNLGSHALFVTGSAIGASGYWLLVRQFWMKSLPRLGLCKTVGLCAATTLVVGLIFDMFGGYEAGIPKINPAFVSPAFTVAWWFAFSISIYWNERSEQNAIST